MSALAPLFSAFHSLSEYSLSSEASGNYSKTCGSGFLSPSLDGLSFHSLPDFNMSEVSPGIEARLAAQDERLSNLQDTLERVTNILLASPAPPPKPSLDILETPGTPLSSTVFCPHPAEPL